MSEPVGAAGATAPAAEPERRNRIPDFLLCAGLALAGAVVLVDALQLSNNRTGTDPLGPKPVPVLVGSLLIILAAALAVAVARGNVGEQEAGEDVDLHAKSDLKTVLETPRAQQISHRAGLRRLVLLNTPDLSERILEGMDDLIPPWDERALYLILVFRIAVLLHRSRSDAPIPEVTMVGRPRTLELRFRIRFRDHPLTAADLNDEIEYLRAQGLRLRVLTS